MVKATAEADDPTVVYLGNRHAIEVRPDLGNDGASRRTKVDGPRKNCTTICLGQDATLLEAVQQITDPARGIWRAHSDADRPVWVAASGRLGPAVAQFLAAHWGIELREAAPTHVLEG